VKSLPRFILPIVLLFQACTDDPVEPEPGPGPDVFLFKSVGVAADHSCALATSGRVYCWGLNRTGQLGDGTRTNHTAATLVPVELTFVSLDAENEQTCAVTAGGAAWCWGKNDWGQLGDGTKTDRASPRRVSGGLTFSVIAVGFTHSCALTREGDAYCWGDNRYGELGNGNTRESSTPVRVSGGLRFTEIGATNSITCALTTAGAPYCWGYAGWGLSEDFVSAPQQVPGGFTFRDLAVHEHHFCGITGAGDAYCWGFDNQWGQLGNGTRGFDVVERTPVKVVGGLAFSAITAGLDHTCAVTTAGPAYCWGSSAQGQLGVSVGRHVQPRSDCRGAGAALHLAERGRLPHLRRHFCGGRLLLGANALTPVQVVRAR
jgi:alpha-tubulin suppressor-like RCC1 family protein